ncbi:HAMP domain-containing sensor histidine kinase [Intestinibacillus sp. Marseille-P6563]|uniref:HAMP domain-containing sensor histidine kinase n=1 Tax=Intestinibacillus sp. Marseille-P6563 TaxID=2364792 RepID=UPI000F05E332|nr:HAMP domain-containing sensor histidine kinase [Intestinibacillus sp. Marseille-P6563]
MGKRSFFFRNYLSHSLLIVFAFLLAGTLFSYQFGSYVKDEKQQQLESTASAVASQTTVAAQALDDELVRELYNVYITQIANSDQVSILVANPSGDVVFYAAPDELEKPKKDSIGQSSLRAVLRHGQYSGLSTLGGVLPSTSYFVGAACLDENEQVTAYVFVTSPASVITDMMDNVSRMFILVMLIALVGTLIISYFISARMTAPLKIMALAAREYAAGNFDIRVPEDNHCTEIDELAVSFNNMARDLAQLDELTRGFIGNVSHEFKTPMTTIGGFVDGMLDGTIPPDQQQKYLRIISEEVGRLSRMVVRMLDAAKIQSGELILNTAPFDFTEMSSQIILSFERKILSKNLEVDIDFQDGLIVNGDRDHVFRAVYNLVDNAVKFINTDGKLTLRAHAEGTMCAFSIKNTGAGIAPEDIPHVFDRFYKTDRSRSLDRSGAGLGLYIVKNIINLHGGDISVRSDGGETEFSLTLPLVDKKSAENFINSSQSRQ